MQCRTKREGIRRGKHGNPPLERLHFFRYQAGFLACGIGLLSVPSQDANLSGTHRFRSAYSCGAAMDFHHLPWL